MCSRGSGRRYEGGGRGDDGICSNWSMRDGLVSGGVEWDGMVYLFVSLRVSNGKYTASGVLQIRGMHIDAENDVLVI